MKLLAVDDLRDNLLTLGALVKAFLPEATLLTSLSGQQGIEIARAEQPDTILLDIQMPGLDGYETTRRLKTDPLTAHIPILLLTAVRSDGASKVRGLEAGAEAFLSKPLEEGEFVAQIRSMVRLKRSEDALRRERDGLERQVAERVRDLEEKQRQRQLAQDRFQSLFEGIGDAVLIHPLVAEGPRANFVEVNSAACRVLGYTREELLRMSPRDLDAPESEVDVGRVTRDLCACEPVIFEQLHRTRDGRRIPVEIHAHVAALAGEKLVFSVCRDITERKRAEEAQRENAEHHRAVVRTSMDGFVSVDLQGRLLEVNETYCRMSGYGEGELLAMGIPDLEAAESAADAAARIRTLVEAGPSRFESRHRRKDGSVFDVEVSVQYQPAGGGRIVAFLRDISERKQLEAERARLEADLVQAQKMEAIGTLAGGIAHDFNNILTPILGHGELALLQLPEGHPVREDIHVLLKAAERAGALVRQILAISRREEGASPVPVHLGALIRETAKFLRASIPATIELRVDVDPACGPVCGDATRLHQVVLNLCTNARDAMADRGGTLTLSLVRDTGGPGSAPRVRLTVSDTGGGIPADALARIFEPYFTTKPVGKGTGLGLAVAHGIVAALGGEFLVRSSPGVGTVFDVLLPELEGEEAAQPKQARGPQLGCGQHVLVVDDEAAIRAVLERLLRSLGYRVTTCSDGAEALAAVRRDPGGVDAVLTDYTMPGLTGIALAAELKELRPGLPVLLGTGFAEGIDEPAAGSAGLQGLLMKPYSIHSLGEALQGALAG